MKFFYYLPRVLGIVFALFLAVFAFDVFAEGYSGLESAVAFVMQLIPSFIVAAALMTAWSFEFAGGVVFIGLGVFYTVFALGHPFGVLIIAGPSFLIGVLFLILKYKKCPK